LSSRLGCKRRVEPLCLVPIMYRVRVVTFTQNGSMRPQSDFVEAIQNPRDERHEELLEWVGGDFDPEAFDLEATNEELQELG